jgi:hypothetical protein
LVLSACAWDCFQRGLTGRGREVAREMQERGRRTGDPRLFSTGLNNMAWFDLIEERYDDMLANASEGLRTAVTPFDRGQGEVLSAMALGFQGQIAESVNRLQVVREHHCAVGWIYMTTATDMPLGVAKVMQGDLAGGVRSLEELLKYNQEIGFVVGRDMVRLLIAEIYIMLLQSKKLPPLAVLWKNLGFILVTMFSGWNKALALSLATRSNPIFAETSYWRARTETDLGVLYLMKKRYGEANECFQRARPMATQIQHAALLAKIDGARAQFPPSILARAENVA